MMKRGYYGVYHRMSPAHLQRYVNEFAGRHNTLTQMASMWVGMAGKRLRWKDFAPKRKTVADSPP